MMSLYGYDDDAVRAFEYGADEDDGEAMWREDRHEACGRASSPFAHAGFWSEVLWGAEPFRPSRCSDAPKPEVADDIAF